MNIRRELFAVQVYEDCVRENVWVTQKIYRSLDSAKRYRKDVRGQHHRSFPLVDPRLVHPSQFTVEAFVGCGNMIED